MNKPEFLRFGNRPCKYSLGTLNNIATHIENTKFVQENTKTSEIYLHFGIEI